MPKEKFSKKLPPWLYTQKARGRFNPAGLSTKASPPVLSPKKVILDVGALHAQNYFDLKSTISALLQQGFEIYLYHSDEIKLVTSTTDLDGYTEKSSGNFNMEMMWKELYEQYGLNRKDCVSLGLETNVSEKDIKNFFELFIADFLNKDNFDTTIIPFLESLRRENLGPVFEVMRSYIGRIFKKFTELCYRKVVYSVIPTSDKSAFDLSEKLSYEVISLSISISLAEQWIPILAFVLSSPEDEFLYLHCQSLSLKEALVKMQRLDPTIKAILHNLSEEKINEFFFHQLDVSFGESYEDYIKKLFALIRRKKLDADFFKDIIIDTHLESSLPQEITSKPQFDWIYDGVSLRERTVFDTVFNRKDVTLPMQALFHCTKRGKDIFTPAWLENEKRMAVGKVYHYNGKKLTVETSNLSDLQLLPLSARNNDNDYELEIYSKNLRHLEIVFPQNKNARNTGFRYYLIPINHPDLRLIYCNQKDAEIVKDKLGRYLLKTRDLNRCKVTVGIPNKPSSNIIDNTNYRSFQDELAEKGILEIIQVFFDDTFSQYNKQNILCSERAQTLLKNNSHLQKMCYYVENSTHAFLKIKGTNYSIDLGGAHVKKVYRAEKLPKKTIVSRVISPPPHTLFNAPEITESTLWKEHYDKQKEAYKKKLIQTLNPVQEEKALLPLKKETFLSMGIQGVIGNPITTLKAVSQWEIPSTAWQYYSDVNHFLKMIQENGTPNAEITHVINLSPWFIADQGQRDRLRVKLHEWLITYKDTHRIVLLTDDANSFIQDRSMVSRMTGCYQAPNLIFDQQKSEEMDSQENENNTELQTINIHAVLQKIYSDLKRGEKNITIHLFFSPEDNSEWTLLQNIIQEINITGKMYLDGQYYPEQGRYNNIQIQLKQVALPLKNLFDKICPAQNSNFNDNVIYYLNPHLAQYGLLSFLKKHSGESISLVLTQPLPEKIWYQLLSEAKKQRCTFCLRTMSENYWPKDIVFRDDAVFESYPPVIQQPSDSMLIPVETLQCNDLFYHEYTGGPKSLVQRLAAGEHITLYAHDYLDNEGDLQQLLIPLLHGYAIGLNGEYIPINGKLSLNISPKDEISKQYFPWLQTTEFVDIDTDNATAQSESLSFNPTLSVQTEREEALGEVYQQLPHIQDDDYIFPNRITELRQKNILNLWKLFGTLVEKTNVLSCALIEGPSSIGKTTLVKLLMKQCHYTLVDVLNVSDLRITHQPIAYVFKGDEDTLLTCLQHAKKQGQILIFDEINTLSLPTQEKIIALLKQEDHMPGFCFIGTLNQGYYPGRESFLSELKYYSQPFVFEQYNPEELHDIMRQKLTQLKLKDGEQVESEFIDDVIVSVCPSIEAKDGVLRFFIQSLQTLSLPLASLYWSWLQKKLAETSAPKSAKEYIINNENDARPVLTKIHDMPKLSQNSYMRFYHKGVEEFKKYLKDYIEANPPEQYSSHDALLRAFGKSHKTKANKVAAAQWCLDMLNGKDCSSLYEQHNKSLNEGTLGTAFQRIQNQLFSLNKQLIEPQNSNDLSSIRNSK